MKTKIILKKHWVFISLFALLYCLSCNDLSKDELNPGNEVYEKGKPWIELIEDLDIGPGIIVQKDASIQNAIDAAQPGDIIYIEPGIYRENISIDKQSIRFIGLYHDESNPVILENPGNMRTINLPFGTEINNIQLRNYNVVKSDHSSSRMQGMKQLLNITRDELGAGLIHYQFDVRMGEGEFDVIGLHRIVKERNPYHPVKTQGNVFMIHGASQNFEDIFLVAGAEDINGATSAPYYLAMHNIDVWGIDLAWTYVPLGTSDFSFMQGWGIEKDIDHTLKGISIARMIRGITGQSFKRMNLLGFSYGVGVVYGAASKETQLFHMLQNIKGLIPVDNQLKSDNDDFQNGHCLTAQHFGNEISMGNYALPQGVGIKSIGQAVLADPYETTLSPPLTNLQFISAIASDHSNGSHFLGGTPFELNYTDPFRFARLTANLHGPYMSHQVIYDIVSSGCPSLDPIFDDHLSEIMLPILNISAQGGSGPLGDYTSALTQTTDYTLLNIDDLTRETEVDFGHADLWMAEMAPEWVWEPLANWLKGH